MQKRTERIISAAAGLAGGLLILHSAANWLAGVALSATLRAQKARGIPVTMAQVLGPDVAEADNAAVPLQRAFALMDKGRETLDAPYTVAQAILGGRDAVSRNAGTNAPARQPQPLRQLVEHPSLTPIYEALDEAVAMPRCRFAADPSKGPGMLLPHVIRLRGVVRLLQARAHVRAAAGATDAALDDVRRCLRLSAHLGHDPFLLALLTRTSCDLGTLDVLNAVLSGHDPKRMDERRLRVLATELAAAADRENATLVRALDGERVLFGGWAFSHALDGRMQEILRVGAAGKDRPPWWLRLYGSYALRPLVKLDLRRYAVTAEKYRAAASEPYARTVALRGESEGSVNVMTSLLLPAMRSSFDVAASRQAVVEMARAAVGLALYHRERGRYPAALAEVVFDGPRPRDPFGQDLAYRVQGEGYTVYSVGPNLKDDGGRVRLPSGDKGDIVWTYRAN